MLVSLRLPGAHAASVLGIDGDGRWVTEESGGGRSEIGRGLWAVPGLVDAHAHLAADELHLEPTDPSEVRRRAYACLDRGAFLIVEKGWSDDVVIATLSATPPTERPDFEGASRMIATEGGYYPGFAVETDEAGLEEVVADAAKTGAGWVKLVGDWPRPGRGAVANFAEDALRSAVSVAHAAGARVAIHTMAPDVPSMAVRAGIDSIEHGLFLTESDLMDLGARSGAWVPTLMRVQAIADMLGPDSTGGRLMLDGLENMRRLLSTVPEGVAVMAGTDLAAEAGDVGREVMRLLDFGLDSGRALAAATSVPRLHLGLGAGFEPGSPADAVFFDRDPLERPDVLSRPVAVMRRGRLR